MAGGQTCGKVCLCVADLRSSHTSILLHPIGMFVLCTRYRNSMFSTVSLYGRDPTVGARSIKNSSVRCCYSQNRHKWHVLLYVVVLRHPLGLGYVSRDHVLVFPN